MALSKANSGKKLRRLFQKSNDDGAITPDVIVDGDLLEVVIWFDESKAQYGIKVPYEEDRVALVLVTRSVIKRWKAEYDFADQIVRRASSGEHGTSHWGKHNLVKGKLEP